MAVKTGRKMVQIDPERLTNDLALRANAGVTVYADSKNKNDVWFGFSNEFTVDFNDETDGFPLKPGASMLIPARHPADIYVCSVSKNNQKIWWTLS